MNGTVAACRCPAGWRKPLCLMLLAGLLLAGELANAQETVRMGFYQGSRRDMSRTDLRSSFYLWSQELAASFKVPVTVSYFDDVASLRQAFDRGDINGVSADAMTLARNFNLSDLADGYSVAMPGSWNLLLLTGRESAIHSVRDLTGKRIVLLEDDPAGTVYLETLCLQQYGRDCSKVFSEILRVPSNNQAVLRLFFGKTDLVMVYRYAYDLAREMNPQLDQKIGRVVEELPLPGMFYAFFSSKVDREFRSRVLRIIPTMHTYPRGRQLMDIFKMDHLEVANPQELKPFLQLDQNLRELKTQTERKGKGK